MSIFLNIASAVLILPLVAFSLFILSVDMISGRPLGVLFARMLDVLFFCCCQTPATRSMS